MSDIQLEYGNVKVALSAEIDAEKVTTIAYNCIISLLNAGLSLQQSTRGLEQPAKEHTQNAGTTQDGKTAEAGLYQ